MATLTFSLTSGPITGSKSYTLSDADVTRWMDALRTTMRDPALTNAQVLSKWADIVVDNAKAKVKHVEGAAAAQAVSDIAVS